LTLPGNISCIKNECHEQYFWPGLNSLFVLYTERNNGKQTATKDHGNSCVKYAL